MGIGRPAASVGNGDCERAASLRLFGAGRGIGTPWAAAKGAAMSRALTNVARRADVIFTPESLFTTNLLVCLQAGARNMSRQRADYRWVETPKDAA
jgi:hypothetical protein